MSEEIKTILPKAHWALKISAEKDYLKKLEKLARELTNPDNVKKSTELTKARWDVEFFELSNKISTTRQFIKNLEFNYENFIEYYENQLKIVEAQWVVFSEAIKQFEADPAVIKVYEEFGTEIENIEIKYKIFYALKHKVNM